MSPWTWHPHPDVWLLVAVLGGGYVYALRRVGPRHVPEGTHPASRTQMVAFAAGLLTMWLGADWPLHDIGESYLYSVHMTQHLLFTLLAPPLLLLGTPGWLARELLRAPRAFAVFSRLARPLPALILFNALIVITHWPAFVDLTLEAELAHFGAHAAIFVAAVFMWCPVVAPLPELRLLSPPAQMLYLFLQSVVPTVPASFLVFAERPIYRFYETVPRLWGLSAGEDQRIGGLLMKLGGGMLLWGIITVIFFRWHSEEESADRSARRWRALERELDDPVRWNES
ncbi:MAG: cytochrome c oxidase assembly protein [Acidimicrobiia bacterium]